MIVYIFTERETKKKGIEKKEKEKTGMTNNNNN